MLNLKANCVNFTNPNTASELHSLKFAVNTPE